MRIAVLTVSDTRGLDDDKSGATLADLIRAGGHELRARAIVKDDVSEIRAKVQAWIADAGVDVVITTGGTGFTGRDVTPEAVKPLFEKEVDGFSTVFHMISFAKIATSTIQSRACAGVARGPTSFVFRGPRVPAGTPGTRSSNGNSTTATAPAISSRSCRGSRSIAEGARAGSLRIEAPRLNRESRLKRESCSITRE